MSRTRIDPSLLNNLSSSLNMGSNKIVSLANGTAASDAAAFGQIPTITQWTSYTPSIGGVGTPSVVNFRWRQVNDTVYINGVFRCGTTTASIAYVTLPNSFTISYDATHGLSTFGALVGNYFVSINGGLGAGSNLGFMWADGSNPSGLFFINAGATSGTPNGIPGNGFGASLNYVFVDGWFIKA